MHPQAKFVALADMSSHCEFSHRGVVLRVRDGVPEHAPSVVLVDDGAREEEGPPSGVIVPDPEKRGVWLVPEKYRAEAEAWVEAKAAEAKAKAEADAAKKLEAGKGG